MEHRTSVSHARLLELFSYDPDTGIFTRLKTVCGGKSNKGDIAGTSTDSSGYPIIKIDQHTYKAHRLAVFYMTEEWPPEEVDHRDGDTRNNKWDNLNPVTKSENQKNRKQSILNKSGFTGVYWRKDARKWRAQVNSDGKRINLGTYADINDAIAARKAANIEYGFSKRHGSYQLLSGSL